MLEHILVFTNIFVSIICLHMYLLCFSPYVLLCLPRYFVLYFYVATLSVIGRKLWLTLYMTTDIFYYLKITTIFRVFKKFDIVYKLCFYIVIYLFSCNSYYIYFIDNKTIYNHYITNILASRTFII